MSSGDFHHGSDVSVGNKKGGFVLLKSDIAKDDATKALWMDTIVCFYSQWSRGIT